jgi:quinol-cytochrome oxidoreductase complex cytochrome b subunit
VMGAGFTGYLLPWTSLSFAATRVGTGIAGAAPLAGPLVQKLLLGGSDVTEVTLTRFFGLHVVAIPLVILVVTGVHLSLVVVHGSSTPPSRTPPTPPLLRGGEEGGMHAAEAMGAGPTLDSQKAGETPAPQPPALQPLASQCSGSVGLVPTPFWPDFALRELRAWLVVLIGLVLVAGFLPPPVGSAADLLAPTGDDVRPEWYFLGFYRILKILPSHPLGIDQLVWAVFGGALAGAAMVGLPFLDEPVGGDAKARRRQLWPGRLLLGIGAATAWVLTALPGKYLSAGQAAGLNVLAGGLWLGVALILVRMGARAARAPATLFGCVLVLGLVGYVGWEAFGAHGAIVGLALAAGGLALIGRRGLAGRAAAAVLLCAALLAVIALGSELFSPHGSKGLAAIHGRVPLGRVHETAPVVIVALGLLGFLLVIVQLRIRHQDKLRAMGLRPVRATMHAG